MRNILSLTQRDNQGRKLNDNNKTNNKNNYVKSHNITKPSVNLVCLFCSSKGNQIYTCNDFGGKSVRERRESIRAN